MVNKFNKNDSKIKEQKIIKDVHQCDRHKMRERKLNKLKAMYGKNYDPQSIPIIDEYDGEYEELLLYNGYFEGEGGGNNSNLIILSDL